MADRHVHTQTGAQRQTGRDTASQPASSRSANVYITDSRNARRVAGGRCSAAYREDAEEWEASLLPPPVNTHTEVHLQSS